MISGPAQVDLRTLLLESPDGKWYIAVAKGTIDQPLELIPQSEPLADSSHLPEAGYFLRPAERTNAEKPGVRPEITTKKMCDFSQ